MCFRREVPPFRELVRRFSRGPERFPKLAGGVLSEGHTLLAGRLKEDPVAARAVEERVAPVEEDRIDPLSGPAPHPERSRSWSGSKLTHHRRTGPAMTFRLYSS